MTSILSFKKIKNYSQTFLDKGGYLRSTDGMISEANKKLFIASVRGDIKAIGRALKEGASLKARDEKKMTALAIAARSGNIEVLQYLLDLKAPVTNEILAVAEISGTSSIEIVKMLQIVQMRQAKPQTKYNSTVDSKLLKAAFTGDLKKLKEALAKYGDADAIDGLDTTALRWAARFNHRDIVDELLTAGAKVNLQSKTGWSALMEAIVAGSAEIVDLLIKHGADVNARTFVNATPLYFAQEKGIDEIIKLLKKNKAKYQQPGS